MSSDTSIQYYWVDGTECLERYEPGGYHPVKIEDLLHNRYRIVDKLGYGGYSTIWLARDEQVNRFVAIKIGTSEVPKEREISIIQALQDSSGSEAAPVTRNVDACTALPKILDVFDICGPNGNHKCYTFTPAHANLGDASWCRLFPLPVARALAARLATVVAFVHSRGFVHGDIRLRNILVQHTSTFDELSVPEFTKKYGEPGTVPINRIDGKPLTDNVPVEAVLPKFLGKASNDFTLADAYGLILSDFGEAFSPVTEQRLGKDCCIPLPSMGPEALFEPDMAVSYPFDIWSLGTAIWQILGMKFIFADSEGPDEVVAEQIDVFGPQGFPESWREQWEREGEEEDCVSDRAQVRIPRQPTEKRTPWPCLEEAFEKFVQKYRREEEAVGVFDEEETQAVLELMRGMLKFRPEERLTIDEVLRSRWMVKWALPQLEESRTSGSPTS